MKRGPGVFAVLLAVMPVAAWELNSSDTKKSWSYAAFQTDKSDAVELQFYCDNAYPEDIQMLVFTDIESDGTEEGYPRIEVTVTVDGKAFADLDGYYDDVEGERTVVIDTLEEDRVRDVLAAAQQASNPVVVSFGDRVHRFAIADIATVLGNFLTGCER